MVLTMQCMMKAFVMLKLNCKEISARFSLKAPPVKAFFQKFRLGFTSWRKAYNKWAESKNEISAQDAWNTLLYHNAFWPRLVRVSILVTLYLIFTVLLRSLFFSGRQAFVPARGEKAFWLSYYVLIAVTIAFTVLCFYVIDAIQLNANFIRVLTKGFTKWRDPARLPGRRDNVLSDKE